MQPRPFEEYTQRSNIWQRTIVVSSLPVKVLSSYFYVSQLARQTYIWTMWQRPFGEWIEKGHQRDANLCGACARPTDERSLVRGGGVQPRLFCILFQAVLGVNSEALIRPSNSGVSACFFVSLFSKTQPNHWAKRMARASTRLVT